MPSSPQCDASDVELLDQFVEDCSASAGCVSFPQPKRCRDELADPLEGRGFDLAIQEPVKIDSLLPPIPESEDQWLWVRRADGSWAPHGWRSATVRAADIKGDAIPGQSMQHHVHISFEFSQSSSFGNQETIEFRQFSPKLGAVVQRTAEKGAPGL